MAPSAPLKPEPKLTLKQSRFVHEYLVDGNATQAAIRAGYAPMAATQAGSRLLTYGHVATTIRVAEALRVEKRFEQTDPRRLVSVGYILDKLKLNLERSLQERPVLDRDGKRTGEYTYNGAVANKALELLGKAVRMFSDDLDGPRGGGGNVVNIERVEVYLDSGRGPPVLDGESRPAERPAITKARGITDGDPDVG
jgi:phage terminase small subunit